MGRASKVNELPDEVRAWLDKALSDRKFTGYKALEALLKEKGYDISHAAIHRHGQKLEKRLAAIQVSTEYAKRIAEAAPDEADNRSEAVLSLLQTGMFDALLEYQEAEEAEDPAKKVKLFGSAAVSFSKLVTASVQLKKWQDQVADKLDAMLKDSGKKGKPWLDKETVEHVKKVIYGL